MIGSYPVGFHGFYELDEGDIGSPIKYPGQMDSATIRGRILWSRHEDLALIAIL